MSAAAVDATLGSSEATLDEAEVKRQLAAMAKVSGPFVITVRSVAQSSGV